jgi:hypothetical protein
MRFVFGTVMWTPLMLIRAGTGERSVEWFTKKTAFA